MTVSSETESRLGRWERRSVWPLAAIAVLLLISWSMQVLAQPQGRIKDALDWGIYALWGVFLIDYLVRLWLASERRRWFVRHIPDLAIIALPFVKALWLLRVPHLFGRLHTAGMGALRGRLIVYTTASVALLTYVAALAIFDTERSTFPTGFSQALWWSITTVTSLGYGGLTPNTAFGRGIAVVLGFGGFCLIGVVTATFSSWFVQQVAEDEAADQAVTAAEIEVVRSDLVERINQLAAEVRELKGYSGTGGREPETSL